MKTMHIIYFHGEADLNVGMPLVIITKLQNQVQ